MKKFIYLILLCSFGLTGLAQSNGTLLISSSNNQRFWLFIDDVLQNEYSVPSIQIQRMQWQQQYMVRIEMDNANANCIGQLITIYNQYNGNNYSVTGRNNSYTLNKVSSNVRPALTQNLIQPNYTYYNDYYQYLYPGFGNPGNYWQGSGNNQGRQYQYYQRPGSGGGHHGGNNPPSGNVPGGDYHWVNPPHVTPPPVVVPPVVVPPAGPCRNSYEFSTAMSLLRNENFESGKLQFAKNMTTSGPICVEQIIQICHTFDFENTKLEYAKFAYPYCGDQNLYYLVNAVFQFQSSKDELSRFIR